VAITVSWRYVHAGRLASCHGDDDPWVDPAAASEGGRAPRSRTIFGIFHFCTRSKK
jgi:hypothetical protein